MRYAAEQFKLGRHIMGYGAMGYGAELVTLGRHIVRYGTEQFK